MIGITGIDGLAASQSDALQADDLASVARGLTIALSPVELPDGCRERSWWRLLATDEYDAWLIVWPPGGSVRPHDHGGSAGAFCVVEGELTELTVNGSHTDVVTISPGTPKFVDAGAIHDVVNLGSRQAASVHVYSPPLTEMVFYDDGGLGATSVERVAGDTPLWTTNGFGMS